MNTFRASIASALLVAGQVAMAQQSMRHSARIICTPPSGKLVKMVRPVFPGAKSRGIYGAVILEVEIDKAGIPTSVRLLDGDAALAGAVVEAVKKWRWRPFKLNGEAVEVETRIVVNFEPLL